MTYEEMVDAIHAVLDDHDGTHTDEQLLAAAGPYLASEVSA